MDDLRAQVLDYNGKRVLHIVYSPPSVVQEHPERKVLGYVIGEEQRPNHTVFNLEPIIQRDEMVDITSLLHNEYPIKPTIIFDSDARTYLRQKT